MFLLQKNTWHGTGLVRLKLKEDYAYYYQPMKVTCEFDEVLKIIASTANFKSNVIYQSHRMIDASSAIYSFNYPFHVLNYTTLFLHEPLQDVPCWYLPISSTSIRNLVEVVCNFSKLALNVASAMTFNVNNVRETCNNLTNCEKTSNSTSVSFQFKTVSLEWDHLGCWCCCLKNIKILENIHWKPQESRSNNCQTQLTNNLISTNVVQSYSVNLSTNEIHSTVTEGIRTMKFIKVSGQNSSNSSNLGTQIIVIACLVTAIVSLASLLIANRNKLCKWYRNSSFPILIHPPLYKTENYASVFEEIGNHYMEEEINFLKSSGVNDKDNLKSFSLYNPYNSTRNNSDKFVCPFIFPTKSDNCAKSECTAIPPVISKEEQREVPAESRDRIDKEAYYIAQVTYDTNFELDDVKLTNCNLKQKNYTATRSSNNLNHEFNYCTAEEFYKQASSGGSDIKEIRNYMGLAGNDEHFEKYCSAQPDLEDNVDEPYCVTQITALTQFTSVLSDQMAV